MNLISLRNDGALLLCEINFQSSIANKGTGLVLMDPCFVEHNRSILSYASGFEIESESKFKEVRTVDMAKELHSFNFIPGTGFQSFADTQRGHSIWTSFLWICRSFTKKPSETFGMTHLGSNTLLSLKEKVGLLLLRAALRNKRHDSRPKCDFPSRERYGITKTMLTQLHEVSSLVCYDQLSFFSVGAVQQFKASSLLLVKLSNDCWDYISQQNDADSFGWRIKNGNPWEPKKEPPKRRVANDVLFVLQKVHVTSRTSVCFETGRRCFA